MFSHILIYINVPVLICLDPNGNNVCSKFVSREINSKTVKDFSSECCPDFYKKNDTCQICPAGTYGIECKNECDSNYHGLQCKKMCNCLYGYICNSIQGCIRNSTENCTDPECMSETTTIMLKNDDIGTLTVTSLPNRSDGDSILSHVHIYLIIVSCTTLLILIALASVRKGHSACKTNGKKPHHSIKEKRPDPNDIKMRRLPRAPSSGGNYMFQQRTKHQLIEV